MVLLVRRHWRKLAPLGVAALILLMPAFVSYVGYLTAPGAAGFDVRTADWLRDHHLDIVVDTIEQVWFGWEAPGNGEVDPALLPVVRPPTPAQAVSARVRSALPRPPDIQITLSPPLAGEGEWRPSGRSIDGHPTTYVTYLRPDPDNTKAVASVVWLDTQLTRLAYVPGTKGFKGVQTSWGAMVPKRKRKRLVAAFNSGFRFWHALGGVYADQQVFHPLVPGKGSIVIYKNGSVKIGAWGQDVQMGPRVSAVRQNLDLIVRDNHVADGIDDMDDTRWGRKAWQVQYTRRSGLGVTDSGALIYAVGSHLSQRAIATTLALVGAQRAVMLDIHQKHPIFNFYGPDPQHPKRVRGFKLSADLPRSEKSFLRPEQRDFFAVLLR